LSSKGRADTARPLPFLIRGFSSAPSIS